MKMREVGNGESRDIDDLRTTSDLIFNLPHPRVNKTDQHYHQHTHIRIYINLHMLEETLNNKDEEKETAWSTHNINEGKEREEEIEDYARKYGQSE